MTDIVFMSGGHELPARLADTPTARLIAKALPLYLTAIFWGRLVRMEAPLDSYRENDAVRLARLGQILWSPEREEILIPYGATPISLAGEIRLNEPSNVWAEALEDVQILREVHDGAKVTIARYGTVRSESRSATGKPRGAWR